MKDPGAVTADNVLKVNNASVGFPLHMHLRRQYNSTVVATAEDFVLPALFCLKRDYI